MILRSVRARLTFYYTLALALIMLLFSVGVYLLVRADLSRQMDLQLAHDLAIVSAVARNEQEDTAEIERQGGICTFEIESGGRVLVSTRSWRQAGLGKVRTAAWPKDTTHTLLNSRQDRYYLRAGNVLIHHEGKEDEWPRLVLVKVARDGQPMLHTLQSLAMIVLIGFFCAIGLAVAGGYFMAGRVLAPVGAMASKATAITADRLSERLPVHNPDDELGKLATAFNSTLARLQDSFDRLRRFTSDASHELRTPLTAIKSVGEVSLRHGNDPSACRDAISSMLEEADRLARLVDSLLTLTRADAGTARLSHEQTNLGELTIEVVECLRVLADEKGLTISIDAGEGITADIDRATFRQAVMNLLDNAIKYTPESGSIAVAVRRAAGRTVVEITDNGTGIAEEHRGRVFERFYRAEKARSGVRGAGLGLAIAQWAAEANGGTIELETQDGSGSTFRIVLADGKPAGAKPA